MRMPKLNAEDHALRKRLIHEKNGPRMTPKAAFDFVVGKALDRERSKK